MVAFPAGLGLAPERAEHVIRLAGLAPSLHNRQPWRFRVLPDAIELHADVDRRMPFTDPEDAELRLSCGGALMNLRLALEHEGIRPVVTLMPERGAPTLLATVESSGHEPQSEDRATLYRAITARRTNRRPFLPTPVPRAHADALVTAARAEHCWLAPVRRDQRGRLLRLVRQAHDTQRSRPGVVAEAEAWTGRREGSLEGVPATAAGPRPEPQDEWVRRDFSAGQAPARVEGKDFEDDPLVMVLCSYASWRSADIQAGEAMQSVLLTMTALGLAASFISEVVEVPETKKALGDLLGDTVWPQMVLRIGYGSPVPATRRRAAAETLLDDELATLELGPQEPQPPD